MKNLQIVQDLIKNRDIKLLELAYEDLGLYGSLRSRKELHSLLFLVKSKTKKREPVGFLISSSEEKNRGLRNSLRSDSPRPFSYFLPFVEGKPKPHIKKINIDEKRRAA